MKNKEEYEADVEKSVHSEMSEDSNLFKDDQQMQVENSNEEKPNYMQRITQQQALLSKKLEERDATIVSLQQEITAQKQEMSNVQQAMVEYFADDDAASRYSKS